jgi:hypothetical protein
MTTFAERALVRQDTTEAAIAFDSYLIANPDRPQGLTPCFRSPL